MAKKEIRIERTLDAPVEKVWLAWTDPKQLQQWWAPRGFTNPTVEIDARVGGELYILMQGGENMGSFSGMKAPMKGVFTEVIEQQKLAFSNEALDESGNVLLSGMTEVTFEADGERTKLTIKTSAEGIAPQAAMMLAGMEQGWNQQTDKLGEFLAR